MYVHGGYNTRLYRIWCGMKYRCYNRTFKYFEYYGGRGIEVCAEWLNNFDAFRKWALESGYREDLTIDRKDTNGSYTPDNCRWVSQNVQTQNRRPRKSTVFLSYGGQSLTAKEWSDKLNVSVSVIRNNFLHTGTPYNKHQLCNTREGLQHQRSPGV